MHRGLAALVRTEPRNLNEAVAAVQDCATSCLSPVSRRSSTPRPPTRAPATRPGARQRRRRPGAPVPRSDKEALELSEALTLHLKTSNAHECRGGHGSTACISASTFKPQDVPAGGSPQIAGLTSSGVPVGARHRDI
jgi:hypothetical protein